MWHDVKLLNGLANTLFGIALAAVLASGLWWVAQRPLFTLKSIQVEGESRPLRHVSASTIRNTALPRIRGNFFTANLDSVRSAFEAVPWVRRATVRRSWPNGLVVTLEEHQPLGTWGEDGRLLSVNGEIFTANLAEAEEDGDLPEFAGPTGSEKDVVARFRELSQWLQPVKLAPVALSLSGRYAWTVKLDNGTTLQLGREQGRELQRARVERLVAIWPQLVARLQGRIENIDMRYPNGLSLKAQGLELKDPRKAQVRVVRKQ
jgi:cell division protein FtsQ